MKKGGGKKITFFLDEHKIQKMSRSSRWIYDKLHFETDKKTNAIVIM